MALNLSIKNVPEALAEKLRVRAEANHRSLQGELMALIESSVRNDETGADTNRPATQQNNNILQAKRIDEPRPDAAPKLTLRDIAARMRSRFPAPVAPPPGMSAVELVRQMRDGRDGSQWRDAGHHDKGY